MKQELDGGKRSLRDVEKSLEVAWDSINENMPTKPRLSPPDLDLLKVNLKKVDSQQAENKAA